MARIQTLVAATAFLIFEGGLLFLIAGTVTLLWVWVYLVARFLFTVGCVVVMSEDVARERLKPGPGAKREPVYNIGAAIAWVIHFLIVPLDLGRFHWSAGFPIWLHWIGLAGMLAAQGLVIWALQHNEFMSAKIRLQSDRGQYVISSGPYALVRHPNYAGGVLLGLSGGLVFGSWPSILPMLLYIAMLIYRTLQEEKMLFAELEGYADYAAKVRWRFLPLIW